MALGLVARTYGVYFMAVRDPFLERMRDRFKLEHGLLVGGAIILPGLIGGMAATGVVVGVQIFFTSFLLSILGLRRPR
jgi:hypothetical protein